MQMKPRINNFDSQSNLNVYSKCICYAEVTYKTNTRPVGIFYGGHCAADPISSSICQPLNCTNRLPNYSSGDRTQTGEPLHYEAKLYVHSIGVKFEVCRLSGIQRQFFKHDSKFQWNSPTKFLWIPVT